MNSPAPVIELSLLNFTNDFYSGISGLNVGKEIDRLMMMHPEQLIRVSMYGIENVSPSFINGAFLYVIDLYGAEYFRKYLKIVQISQRLLPQIKEAIDAHIERAQGFYKNLKTNTIFVGIDGGNKTMRMRTHLFDTLQNSIRFLRNKDEGNRLTAEAQHDIQTADTFIGLWTVQNRSTTIVDQANYAMQLGKPCLILCSKPIYVRQQHAGDNKLQLVRFDEENPILALRALNKIILDNQVRKPFPLQQNNGRTINALEVAGWALLGAAGIWLLSELLKKEE